MEDGRPRRGVTLVSERGAHGGDEAWIEKYRAALHDAPAERSRFESVRNAAKSMGAALLSCRDKILASSDVAFGYARKFLAHTTTALAERKRRSSPVKTSLKKRVAFQIHDGVKSKKAG
jgi:hypothetical protein